MIGNAGGAARQVLDALGSIGRRLIAFAEELVGRFGKGVAGEGAERTAKEAAQEASERTAKEAAQQGAETATKEATETAAEQGTKQADEAAEQATKQGDEAAEQATKQGDEAAEQTTKQGDEAAEQTTKQGDEAAEQTKQGDEADQGGKKGDQPDLNEKLRVAAEAAVDSNLMEAAGIPAVGIATALKRTFQPRYRWIRDFQAELVGPGKSVIWMIASKLKVDTVLDRVNTGRSKDRLPDDEWKNLTQEQRDYVNDYRRRNPESSKSDQFLLDSHKEGWKFTDNGDLYHPQSGKYPPPEDPHRAKFKDQPAPDSPAGKELEDFKRQMSENPSAARKSAAEAREKSAAECELIRNKQGKYADMTDEQRKRALDLEMENLRTASQTLGEQAGREYGEKVLKGQGFEPVKLPSGEANNFDQVFYNPKTGEVVVLECKGATSGLGDRFATDGKTRVQQGTEAYLEAVIAKLEGTDAHRALKGAFRAKDIRYMVVRQPVNINGSLGVVEVKEFNVWRE
jgi:hypothetical protein